jgi:hypothetical protein
MLARVFHSLFNADGFSEQGATDKNHQYGDPECPREDPPEGTNGRDRRGQSSTMPHEATYKATAQPCFRPNSRGSSATRSTTQNATVSATTTPQ